MSDDVGPGRRSRDVLAAAGRLCLRIEAFRESWREVRARATALYAAGARLDAQRRNESDTELLIAVSRLRQVAQQIPVPHGDIEDQLRSLRTQLADAAPMAHPLRYLVTGRRRRRQARAALGELRLAVRHRPRVPDADGGSRLWPNFVRSPDRYVELLSTALGVPVDPPRPGEMLTLRTEALAAELRDYQRAGALWALDVRWLLLGDEPGLGKTVQAIAVAAHLTADGAGCILVVCPASQIARWAAELRRHSELTVIRLHGPDRHRALAGWQDGGGVAVTSFATLWRLPLDDVPALDLLVVDDAHVLANRTTRRSTAIATLTRANRRPRAARGLLLTGRGFEDRLADYAAVICHVQPNPPRTERGLRAALRGGSRHYLRRTQGDVSDELPDVLVGDEWVNLAGSATTAYRQAVAVADETAARRAGYRADGAKLARLLEILADAAEESTPVLVVSAHRECLADVAAALGGAPVLDSRTADPGAPLRALAKRAGHAVLLAELSVVVTQAGPVPPVVVLGELPAAADDSALSSVLRGTGSRRVRVHRLLATDTIDEYPPEARTTPMAAEYLRLEIDPTNP